MTRKLLRNAASSLLLLSFIFVISCNGIIDEPIDRQDDDRSYAANQIDRLPWYNVHPEAELPAFTSKTEPLRLSFYGWGIDKDTVLTVNFPESTDNYRRAILTYRMGAWNQGPGDWDLTTMIVIKNKVDGKFYEFVRAITPYGGSFGADWSKTYYLDVTEYLPMMTGATEFHVYYGGWDATDTHAHTVTMTFDLYEGDNDNTPIFYQNIYDSRSTSNTGYRSWQYGSKQDGEGIEEAKYLGVRNVSIPEGVDELLMKVAITGHGMEQGTFPDRPGYSVRNAAEFDINYYDVVINGESRGKGCIWYKNDTTYQQAGTYKYDRAGWGPGLPINTQYWTIKNIPEDRNMTIDFNLDRYITNKGEDEKSGAMYIVQVDFFGYERADD